MKTTFNLPLLFTVCLFAACQSSSGDRPLTPQEMASSGQAAASTPESPTPQVYMYTVEVDKLNLREQPSKTAKVTAQFAAGDLAEGTGELSSNREEATLRGIPYFEPYIKVSTVAGATATGWAYGGALRPVYAGPNNIKPDPGRVTALSRYLSKLDVKQIENGSRAINYVKDNYSGASGALADAVFLLLERFLFRMETEGNLYDMFGVIEWSEQDFNDIYGDKFNMGKYPVTKKMAENGFRLATAEGTVFPIVDWAKLADFFENKVTPPMKNYLMETLAERRETGFEDGGITIGLDKLAERAIFWEKFNDQNPYFVLSAETAENERWLTLVLLNGSDNTPAYDFETKAARDEFKNNWNQIIQKYPGSALATNVKALMDVYAASGWKRTAKVEEFLSKYSQTEGE